MKKLLTAIILASVLFSGQLFAGEVKKGGTLNVGLHIPFATLDWQATVQHPAPPVQNNVWE